MDVRLSSGSVWS
ncbi:hypothetical protein LINPERHAP2_LOCUS7709 [Linum perenne]